MANLTKGGLRFWGTIFGGPANGSPMVIRREVASGYATALCTGDPIIQVSDGTVARGIGTEGTPSATIYGVAAGFSYYVSGTGRESRPYVPASTTFSPTAVGSANATYCYVIPAPIGTVWEIDADDAAAANDTRAEFIGLIGNNVDIVVGTGDTTTGVANVAADISTAATTNTLIWRIVDIVEQADNDPTASRFKILITPNISAWTNILGV